MENYDTLHYETTYTFNDGTHTVIEPLKSLDLSLQCIARTGYTCLNREMRWVLRVDAKPMWGGYVPITYENEKPLPNDIQI